VMEAAAPREAEVGDAAGRRFTMRIRPYQTTDHSIDGVVITWREADAAERKKASRGLLGALLAGIDRPAAVLGTDLRIEAANRDWRGMFPASGDEPDGWGGAPFLAALKEVRDRGAGAGAHDVDLPAAAGGPGRIRLDVRPVPSGADGGSYVLVIAEPLPPGPPARA